MLIKFQNILYNTHNIHMHTNFSMLDIQIFSWVTVCLSYFDTNLITINLQIEKLVGLKYKF